MTVTPSFHYYIFNIIFCYKLDLSRVSANNADFFISPKVIFLLYH